MKTSVTTRFAGRGPAEIFAASLVALACLAGYALDMQYGQRECETRMLACGQNEVQALVRDITERKGLERRLMEASEREQKRLAQELHDGLCQDLKSLEMETALLEDLLAGQSPEAAAIGEQVNHSVRRAYALARGLLPAWLDEEKLGTALSGLERRYQSQTDGRIRFSVQNEVQTKDAQQAYHVYRIAQEALNNALVHAQASDIELSWRSEGDQRVLEVRDNGKGFDPDAPEI